MACSRPIPGRAKKEDTTMAAYTLSPDQLVILRAAAGNPDRYRSYGEYHACNMFQYNDHVLREIGQVLRSQDFDGVEVYSKRHVVGFRGRERTLISDGLGEVVGGALRLHADVYARALANTPGGKTIAASYQQFRLFAWAAGFFGVVAAVLASGVGMWDMGTLFGVLAVLAALFPLLEPSRVRRHHEQVVRSLRAVGYFTEMPSRNGGNGDAPAPA